MGIIDNISSFFRGGRQKNKAKSDPIMSVNDFGGSRTTLPKFAMNGMANSALPKRVMADLRLDERSLNRASIEQLIDILIDAHPDMSFALWNFIRLSNSGYTFFVFKPGKDEVDNKATGLLRDFIERLNQPSTERFSLSRSLDSVINQLIISTVIRGAASLELVLAKNKKDVAFIAPVDPATITFKFEKDRYIPYQFDGKISLDIPTFFYEALDNLIDNPYGRSPVLGAIQMIAFQMQLLNDIAAVVHNQGYPRFDITILEDAILQRMPPHIRNNEAERQKWLNQKLQEIVEMYESLDPDDAFVHYSSVNIDMAGGG
ncbi:MAG: hypothetical protein QJR05_13485, partial [Thermoanaerobacterium sp.]|nr:hypothetical protein [Thermoanaerobacterium sp.]